MTDQVTTLKTFRIGIIGPREDYSDQLYANGNQQISAFIYIQKQEYDPGTNSWKNKALSPAEQASLSIREYSSSVDAPLPPGWSCDITKNQFDQGLRGSSYQATQDNIEADAGLRADWDSYTRYLRAGTQVAPVQNYQFMARIQLDDGKVYTTHYSDANVSFESKITVSPQRPYVIRVNELVARREDPYNESYAKNKYIDVDTYYWTLPSSLRIRGEEFSGQGYWGPKLMYAYAKNENPLRLGMAIRFTTTALSLGDIGNLPSGVSGSTSITLINGTNMMRGARYSCDGVNASPTYDNLMYWTITDNLGCVSKFVLKANTGDKGNTLDLVQG